MINKAELVHKMEKYGRVFLITSEGKLDGLMWTYTDENGVTDFARKLLQINDLWKEGKKKRGILINEKINVTNFMVWFLDKYPYSLKKMKQNPDCTHNSGDSI